LKVHLPRLWTIERCEDFRAPSPSNFSEKWWLGQFRRLIAQERAGRPPIDLVARWLVLGRHRQSGRRRIGFELPDFINHIIDDADVRTKDRRYAQGQWEIAEKWLDG
jgi:hypothetical protein